MKRSFACLLLMFLLLPSLFAGRTVRISCDVNNTLYLLSDGTPAGTCAAYLNELAKINDWTLEYVPGTWTESIQSLLDGKIDILMPTQKTAEREKDMAFSRLFGGYQMVGLFAKDQDNIYYEDIPAFNDKRIAVTPGSSNADYLSTYAKAKGFTYTPIPIASTADTLKGIAEGDCDLAVFSTMNDPSSLVLVAILTTEPFYYAVSKNNPDLLYELDTGMEKLLVSKPDVVQKCFMETLGRERNVAFTREENVFIKSHRNITVGLYEDTAPLAYTDNGEVKGLYVDILKRIEDETGLAITVKSISRDTYGLDLVRDGSIDFLIGCNDLGSSILEQKGYRVTEAIMPCNTVLVTQNQYHFTEEKDPRFALTTARKYWEQTIKYYYPGSTITYYPSAKACLDAVVKKKVDATFLNTIEYNYQSKNQRYASLVGWESITMLSNTVMTALDTVDEHLFSLVNKAIQRITDDQVNNLLNYYLNIPYHSYSASDRLFIIRMPLIICSLLFLVFALVSIVFSRMRKKNYLVLEKKNQELEIANAAKTDFLSRMSHDMRTPMNGILGLAALMKDKSDIGEIKDDLGRLTESGRYLLCLINDTLDMNTLESGRFTLHPTTVRESLLIKEVTDNTRFLAEEKGVQFTVSLPEEPLPTLVVDASRFQQILMNLLSNAVKYTQKGGNVSFTMKQLEKKSDRVTDQFVVEDNGIGISKAFLPHVFEPFSREERGSETMTSGYGLGMAIVKELVELMGGTIAVESEVNKGSVFTCVLSYPVVKDDVVEQKRSSYQRGSLKGRRILLCEDNPLNTMIAVQLLKKEGMIVTTAENGKQGVELFLGNPSGTFNAILMDVRMPVMDGLAATKAIRGSGKGDALIVPIIAVTANAYESDKEGCLKAGMNAHVAKPFEPMDLYASLASCMHLAQ